MSRFLKWKAKKEILIKKKLVSVGLYYPEQPIFLMFYSQFVIHFHFKQHSFDFQSTLLILLYCKTLSFFVPLCSSFAKTVACIIISRSPPCVFSIPPHLAFRHATMTQWCCVTGQAGHWLFVSIQINHSLFWTDNVINAQKGHRVYSSQAWWGEQGGQRSKWTPLTDCVSLWVRKLGSPIFCKGITKWLAGAISSNLKCFLILLWLGTRQKY